MRIEVLMMACGLEDGHWRLPLSNKTDGTRLTIEDLNSAIAEAGNKAGLIAIPTQTLCELVWVLERSYKVARHDITAAIHSVCQMQGVVVKRTVVEVGLKVCDQEREFADVRIGG